jgi:hypothetical protein
MIGFFSLKTDRMYAVIGIQLDNKYPKSEEDLDLKNADSCVF